MAHHSSGAAPHAEQAGAAGGRAPSSGAVQSAGSQAGAPTAAEQDVACTIEQLLQQADAIKARLVAARDAAAHHYDTRVWDSDISHTPALQSLARARAGLRKLAIDTAVMKTLVCIMREEGTRLAFVAEEVAAAEQVEQTLREKLLKASAYIEWQRQQYLSHVRPAQATYSFRTVLWDAVNAAGDGVVERNAPLRDAVVQSQLDMHKKLQEMYDSVHASVLRGEDAASVVSGQGGADGGAGHGGNAGRV